MTASTAPASAAAEPRAIPVRIQLNGAEANDQLDTLHAVLYDRLGRMAASTLLKVNRADGDVLVAEGRLHAQPEQFASARLVVAPALLGSTASGHAAGAANTHPVPPRALLEKPIGMLHLIGPLLLIALGVALLFRRPRRCRSDWRARSGGGSTSAPQPPSA